MDAVVVVEAAEAGEELLRRAVGLAVAVLVLEHEDVRRLADEDLVARAVGVLARRAMPSGAIDLRRLVEDRRLVGLAVAVRVLEDDDAVALRAEDRPA